MKFNVEKEKVVFDDHYRMLKADVTYDTFGGGTIKTERLAFHRGDSVALLLYNSDTRSVVLTKQFRYPTTRHEVGWLLEIPAGSIDGDECPLDCVKRESIEETGYKLHQPRQLFHFYVSPGGCTERCFLFYAEVSERDKIASGGGKEDEKEDIELINISAENIDEYLKKHIIDAKTLIALQWFQRNISP
jgi:GDP-mannose pyrophosphatase NudK